MNTNSINTISKYLLLFLLILTGASCNDNDDAEDTSIPVLISQNINDGDVVGPSGYVETDFQQSYASGSRHRNLFQRRSSACIHQLRKKYVIPSLVWKTKNVLSKFLPEH